MKGFPLYKIISFLLSIGFFQGCISNNERNPSSYKYPDLPTFFQSEAKRLNEIQPKILKFTQEDGSSVRSDTINQIDWMRELALFSKEDLNKPVYDGKLRLDSVILNDSLHVQLSSLSEKLPITLARVSFLKDEIVAVNFIINDFSPIARRELVLSYKKNVSYSIKAVNAIVGNKTMVFDLHARFIL